MDACLSLQASHQGSGDSPQSFPGLPLAALAGGDSIAERRRCAEEASKRDHVAGVTTMTDGFDSDGGTSNLVIWSTLMDSLFMICRFLPMWFRNRGGSRTWETGSCRGDDIRAARRQAQDDGRSGENGFVMLAD